MMKFSTRNKCQCQWAINIDFIKYQAIQMSLWPKGYWFLSHFDVQIWPFTKFIDITILKQLLPCDYSEINEVPFLAKIAWGNRRMYAHYDEERKRKRHCIIFLAHLVLFRGWLGDCEQRCDTWPRPSPPSPPNPPTPPPPPEDAITQDRLHDTFRCCRRHPQCPTASDGVVGQCV